MAGISPAERERRERLYALGLKQCNTCTEPLPLDCFCARHDGYRGLNGTCKTCKNVASSDYRKRTPEKQADRQARWRAANRGGWLAISRRRDARDRWRRRLEAAA